MDELVNMVAQKINVPPDKAREAVNTVVGFLKEKLPAPIAGHLDGLLQGGGTATTADASGDSGSGDMLGGAIQGIEGMFGGKKE